MADPTVAHADAADATFSATGATNWNKNHVLTGLLNADSPTFAGLTLTGLTSGRVALVGAGGVITDDAGLTYNATTDVFQANGVVGSTKNGGIAFSGNVGNPVGFGRDGSTGSCSFWGGGVSSPVDGNSQGALTTTAVWITISSGGYGWSSTSNAGNPSVDAAQFRGGPNQIVYHGSASGGGGTVTSRAEINKPVTGFTDGVAKAVLTVTIPNEAHSAVLEVEVLGMLGAGGAIGAGEAVATNSYKFVITRTAGVNAVVAPSSAFGAAADAVAGATTATCTAADSAISGTTSATNTFTVDVTITKGGGSSANHTALIYAKLMNNAASGITIA